MSRVPQFKSSQLQLRLPISIGMTHSLNQMPDRQLLQTSVVSTLYESISHFFPVQFLDNINVCQMNSHTQAHAVYLKKRCKHTYQRIRAWFQYPHGHTWMYVLVFNATPSHIHRCSVYPGLFSGSHPLSALGLAARVSPADRRPYTTSAPPLPCQSSVCPYKDMPLYRICLSCPVLHSALAWPAQPLPCSLNDCFSPEAVRRRRWPVNKVDAWKARITAVQESTLLSTSEIFSLCHCEMHKILTLRVGGCGSFLSDGISFDFRKAHVPFLISATVSPGKQQEDSKTKTHTSFAFCLSLHFSPALTVSVIPAQFFLLLRLLVFHL